MVITSMISLTLILGVSWIVAIERHSMLIDAIFVTVSILCMTFGFWHLVLDPSERKPVTAFYLSLYK